MANRADVQRSFWWFGIPYLGYPSFWAPFPIMSMGLCELASSRWRMAAQDRTAQDGIGPDLAGDKTQWRTQTPLKLAHWMDG